MLIYEADDFISKRLPAEAGVGMRLTSANRQDSIEQQNTLTRPAFKVTMIRRVKPGIVFSSSLYIFSSDGGVAMPGRTENARPCACPVRDKDPDRESPL